jgi:hypothetical protein
MIRIRHLAAAATTLLAVGALVSAAAPSASAATTYCATSGHPTDVCAEVISVSNNVVTIRAYPPIHSFTGHFELQTPNHETLNSSGNVFYPVNGAGHTFSNVNGGVGYYCVTAWQYEGGGYSEVGYDCFGA